MNNREVMQQTQREDQASTPEAADQRETVPDVGPEMTLDADERTPEEAGYGYGV